MVQKSRQLELPLESRGEAPRVKRSGQATSAASGTESPGRGALMERAFRRPNMQRALKRVIGNKGSPGVDGMTVEELPAWLREHWPRVREELLAGTYQPSAVRRAVIPKPGGGERLLGIPTVLDRLIQQALLQTLQQDFDATFSEHSYGFRPGRGAHGAMREVCAYVQSGKRWVVDVDLEKFFDRVNHDVLMGRLARRISDRRVLGLIRRYLNAGVMANGVVVERHEGTPQGGPLSPLLANVLLDEVDKELECRGHAFVRYADDLRVFVGSKRAGERIMRSLVKLFGKLRLKVNEAKSAVALAASRPFLGFGLWYGRGGEVKLRVAPKALHKMKVRVRQLTRRTRGRSLADVVQSLAAYLNGWRGYFRVAATNKRFRELDEWIRHRLRAYQLKQWKRGTTVFRELHARGMSANAAAQVAANARRWWRNSAMAIHIALPNKLFDGLGLPRLAS
ncbi:MAG: group II intron reverse transcriptase/maturase [Phycisphaerales bacterium]